MALSPQNLGRLAAATTVLLWASFIVVARASATHVLLPLDIAFAFVSFLPAYVLLVGLGWLPTHFAQASWTEILLQASFQGLGSVVISGISFTQMIRSFGPVKSTMITALVPGLSAFGAVVLLGEPLSWNLAAGLALVTCGILLGVRQVAAKAAT